MTLPAPGGQEPDPERVLAQALRAMAGGGKQNRTAGEVPAGSSSSARLSVLQILLVATIVGLLVGMTVGLVSLLT